MAELESYRLKPTLLAGNFYKQVKHLPENMISYPLNADHLDQSSCIHCALPSAEACVPENLPERRKPFTDKRVRDIQPTPGKQIDYFDAGMRGLVLRVSFGGTKTWNAVHYVSQKPKYFKLGRFPILNVLEAREAARKFLADPQAAINRSHAETFKDVAEDFIKRHVEGEKLRSGHNVARCLRKYCFPDWADRRFVEIRRADVTKLLDTIQDNSGARMADAVLSYVRKLCNWYQARVDDYISPIVRGMNRTKAKARKRKHYLNDAELRTLFEVAPTAGKFGALVIVILLSAQRREKPTQMKWPHLTNELWTIETADREKGNAGAVKLPRLALDLINAQPKIAGNPYVFAAGFGNGHFNSFSEQKVILDTLLRAALPDFRPWVLHDLRRTARSLMSRAGVAPHIAERTLGHAVDDLEDTYDRYEYLEEKSLALEKLAALIATLVDPPAGNIVPITGRAKKRPRSAAHGVVGDPDQMPAADTQ